MIPNLLDGIAVALALIAFSASGYMVGFRKGWQRGYREGHTVGTLRYKRLYWFAKMLVAKLKANKADDADWWKEK